MITVVTPELALRASEEYTLFQGSLLRSERPLHIYFSTPLSPQPFPFSPFTTTFACLGLELNGRAGLPWPVFFLDDRKEVTVVYFVDWVLISSITHTID